MKDIKNINKIVDSSICSCPHCHRIDQDKIYNPVVRKWFCIDCYKELEDYYKQDIEKSLFP